MMLLLLPSRLLQEWTWMPSFSWLTSSQLSQRSRQRALYYHYSQQPAAPRHRHPLPLLPLRQFSLPPLHVPLHQSLVALLHSFHLHCVHAHLSPSFVARSTHQHISSSSSPAPSSSALPESLLSLSFLALCMFTVVLLLLFFLSFSFFTHSLSHSLTHSPTPQHSTPFGIIDTQTTTTPTLSLSTQKLKLHLSSR